MAMGFFLCLGYLTAGVEIFDFRFCGRANVVVMSDIVVGRCVWQLTGISPRVSEIGWDS